MKKKIKCGLWHCAVWITWLFEPQYYGHGNYESPFKCIARAILLIPIIIIFFPIWGPLVGIFWIFSKIRDFAKGPSPCESDK